MTQKKRLLTGIHDYYLRLLWGQTILLAYLNIGTNWVCEWTQSRMTWVLNPIDMRDRDLILIISFVMHFTGIEGHSFLWLEKFPIAIHSWLTIKIVRTNLSLFLSGEFNSLLGGSWWHCSHAAGFHSTPTTTFTIKIVFAIVLNPWTVIMLTCLRIIKTKELINFQPSNSNRSKVI